VIKERIHLERIEFYITNVCNLTCNNCNRFNNYNFKGWQRWSDYSADYKKWSEKFSFTQLVLLGGEPLLNPDITSWITGLNELWPNAGVQILSNGYRLNYVDGLYDLMLQGKCWMVITLHNPNEEQFVIDEIKKFLKSECTVVEIPNGDPYVRAGALYTNKSGVRIITQWADRFDVSSIVPGPNGRLTLHQSDPLQAHGKCSFVRNKNYHFIRGKLYKCGPVALMPEFDQQYTLDISESDREILNSYSPLSADELASQAEDFLKHIDDPIAQCKFCPATHQIQPIFPLRKGLKTS
jgi:hypothetical protein